jgi:hypothetical protein
MVAVDMGAERDCWVVQLAALDLVGINSGAAGLRPEVELVLISALTSLESDDAFGGRGIVGALIVMLDPDETGVSFDSD